MDAIEGLAVSSCATVLLLVVVMLVVNFAGLFFGSAEGIGEVLAKATPPDGSSDMSEDNLGSRVLLTTIPSAKSLDELSELTRRDFEVFSLSPSTSISVSLLLFAEDISLSGFFPLTINVFIEVLSMLVGGRGMVLFRESSDVEEITNLVVVVTGVAMEAGAVAVTESEVGMATVN